MANQNTKDHQDSPPYTTVSVICDYGYAKHSLPGSYEYTLCQTSGTWDQETPTCVQDNETKKACKFLNNYIFILEIF